MLPDLIGYLAAAWIKAAPAGQINRIDHIAFDGLQIGFFSDLPGGWNRGQQCCRIGMFFIIHLRQDVPGGAVFQDSAAVHDGHPVRQGFDDINIVADEQGCYPDAGFELSKQADNFGLDRGVQSGGGLVRNQNRGFRGKGHRDHGALTHAPGQAEGVIVVAKLRRIDFYLFQPVQGPLFGFAGIFNRCVQQNRFLDLPADAAERIHGRFGVLKNHGDLFAAHAPQVPVDMSLPAAVVFGYVHDAAVVLGHVDIIFNILKQVFLNPVGFEPDFAADNSGLGRDQTHNGQGRHTFAAAAFADNPEGLAFLQRQVDTVHSAAKSLLASGIKKGAQIFYF